MEKEVKSMTTHYKWIKEILSSVLELTFGQVVLLHQSQIINLVFFQRICALRSIPWASSDGPLGTVCTSLALGMCVACPKMHPHLLTPIHRWIMVTHKQEVFSVWLKWDLWPIIHHLPVILLCVVYSVPRPLESTEQISTKFLTSCQGVPLCFFWMLPATPCLPAKLNMSWRPQSFPSPVILTFLAGVVLRPSQPLQLG